MAANRRSIYSYVALRIAQALPLILLIITLNFAIIHLAPGDPALVLGGETASPQELEQIRHTYGLDRPLPNQFVTYLVSVLSGNLGRSYFYQEGVLQLIMERIPATLLLMITSLSIFAILGVLVGILSASRPFTWIDYLASIFSSVFYSVPTFWLGALLIITLSLNLRLFPTSGMTTTTIQFTGLSYVQDVLYHLFLPALTLGVFYIALTSRFTRSSFLTVLRMDYITTARSKGLKETTVLFKHGLRNAIRPVISIMSVRFGTMLAGNVLVENLFGWPGLGRLLYNGILERDYPVIMGIFIVISIMVILVNLFADILYAYLDPRIRYT